LKSLWELAGCYVVTTDVLKQNMSAQEVHDSYVSLQERDFRAMKTGLLEVRPFFVRKESRTRGHVFCCMLALKLSREMERRLQKHFGTTESNPHAITLRDALASLGSLSLMQYKVDEKTSVTKLPQPSANQTKILAALGVTLPAKKQRSRQTLSQHKGQQPQSNQLPNRKFMRRSKSKIRLSAASHFQRAGLLLGSLTVGAVRLC
jgi:hypothetical protein